MQVLTENKDKKDYIKKYWGVSSGKKITEMLLRYWKAKLEIKSTEEIAKDVGLI